MRALAGVFLIVLATMSAAHAEQRLALLIGNQSYAAKVGPLQNPRQDVALIEASLKRLGFEVTVLTDADYRNMDVAVKRYVSSLRHAGPGAVGFFYYSGHGASNPETQINLFDPRRCRERRRRNGLVSVVRAKSAHRPVQHASAGRDAVRGVRCLPQRAEPVLLAR